MSTIDEWRGLVSSRRADAEVVLEMPLLQSRRGGSGAFLAVGDDHQRYWVKPLNNGQGPRVPITEQIVARAGALIGAPVCAVKTVEIPSQLVGWEFRPGKTLQAGIAHGSTALENATEVRKLENRNRDDNARRHVYIMAMHDWCWGGDDQWLMDLSDDNRFYSHDHGWYLPETGNTWAVPHLVSRLDEPKDFPGANDGLDRSYAEEVATGLESVARSGLAAALEYIPVSWPVKNEELEAVGFFLEHRAPQVAARIRSRFGVTS